MASAAQTATPQQGVNAAPQSAGASQRPFCQASKVGVQSTWNTSSVSVSSASTLGPNALTASGGFIRRVILETIGSGASTGASTAAGDAPFNLYSTVRFAMPNNTPILELSGYNLMLADAYGGYAGVNDIRNDPDYAFGATNTFKMWPFIPIALDETGMGALSDLSSSSGFQLTLGISASSTIWTVAPGTLPTFAITAYTEYWTLPNNADMNNRPQATTPPYAGTVQLWNQIPNVGLPSGGGSYRLQLNRLGNQLRTVILVTRSGSSARDDTPFPNPALLRWDDVILRNQSPQTIRKRMKEFVNGLTARDTGVEVFHYSNGIGRFVGGNGVSSYLPTVTDTRYELSGTFGSATTPTLDWVINDVSSAPQTGLGRTQVPGGTAYYPPAPQPAANTM